MKTKTLIERLFAQPTAPFREGWVLAEISRILRENRIDHFQDSAGNLLAGFRSFRHLPKRPLLALQAHTDHPGFHLEKRLNPNEWTGLWYGGAPFKTMKGSRLRIYDPSRPGHSVSATCQHIDKDYTREGIAMKLRLRRPDTSLSTQCFGAFDFPGSRFSGDLIHSRAADDLAGTVIALGALLDHHHNGGKGLAIFTRAEEVGFVGCLELLRRKILPPKTHMICLEASRELPMAKLGQGPVLRLGDRSTIYHSQLSIWMWKVAEQLKGRDPKFLYQRRLMDGGSCEATAMNLYGYAASGLAVPLRNYHNQGRAKPAAEVISLSDVDHARRLCAQFYGDFSRQPLQSGEMMQTLDRNRRRLRPLLRAPRFGGLS